MTSVGDRAELAWEDLVRRDEARWQQYGFGVTDSDVLDVISDWTTGSCEDGCTAEECCDYQRLSGLIWTALEVADRTQ